jgi:hypothetical protein
MSIFSPSEENPIQNQLGATNVKGLLIIIYDSFSPTQETFEREQNHLGLFLFHLFLTTGIATLST